MPREAAGERLRQIRALYATGAVGGLSDGQLVERFVDRDGLDREDAFAALVHRHGPMVLAVCRRMLARPADADDAFQAVFLVLARKAGTLRRVDRLKPWLYGAAVRTAKEARRRSARLQALEGASLKDDAPAPARDADLFELRALLDEELHNLPGRYREPLLLCELEGASRQDAALRLGLPEGTLSSRLARGRSMLRDRLTRRGVTLSAGPLVFTRDGLETAGPTVAATVRLALEFASQTATAGAVPVVVASLAEGVLPMLATVPIKTAAAATLALGLAACLTVGLASSPPPAAPMIAQGEVKPEPVAIRGVVVDESGKPVEGADVRLGAYTISEVQSVSGPDGRFALPLPDRRARDRRPLLARTADGRKLGVFQHQFSDNLPEPKAPEPARIVVKPGRPVDVLVTDANRAPIAGAAVEAAIGHVVDHETTDANGAARVLVPPDAPEASITAQKPAIGFDFIHVFKDETNKPDRVDLILDAPHIARVKALDPDGNPVAGVDFYIPFLKKEDRQGFADGRQGGVSHASRLHYATTNAEGVAIFDWLPLSRDGYDFFPSSPGYAHRRAIAQPDGATYIARLVRNETIRGRVTLPGGSPARGVWVAALGTSRIFSGTKQTRTRADGSYEMVVSPDEVYVVYIDDETWKARSRLDVVVRQGKPVEGVDFRLGRGTVVRGTVTIDPEGRPAAGEVVALGEHAIDPPNDLAPAPEPRNAAQGRDQPVRAIPVPPSWIPGFRVGRWVQTKTDERGRYAVRLGPGAYTSGNTATLLSGRRIVVADEPELVRDLRIRIKPSDDKIRLSGKAFGPDGLPVVGANVTITDAEEAREVPHSRHATTDGSGEFSSLRPPLNAFVEATSADGALAGFAILARNQKETAVLLTPTASASGVLLDEVGQPAEEKEVAYWGRWIVDGEEREGPTSMKRVKTDAEGRFTLPSLMVGWSYEVAALLGHDAVKIAVAAPKAAGLLDLGTLHTIGDKDD